MDELQDLLLARRLTASGDARRIRESMGLSRRDVARPAGLHEHTVMKYERLERRPRGAKGAAYGAVLRELIEASAAAGVA